MDHLPSVSDPLPPLHVPFVAEEEIDYGSFLEYPESRDILKESLRAHKWTNMKNAAPLLQTWLFFGLIHAFLDTEIRIEDFVCADEAGRRRVTTRILPNLLEDWYHRCLQLPEQDVSAYHERKLALLICAYDHNILFSGETDKTLTTVSFSVAILIQTLADASIILDNHPSKKLPVVDNRLAWTVRGFRHLEFPFLRQRFLDRGWCLNEFTRLQAKDLPCNTLYYLSNMKHSALSPTESHENCKMDYCRFQEIPEEQYQTLHVDESCSCHNIDVPMRQVKRIIQQGGIPLLAYSLDPSEPIGHLEVTESNPSLSYVAISHVWADGRGNKEGNALPECQLRYIQELVQSVTRREFSQLNPNESSTAEPSSGMPAFFWIDTLCIPVDKKDQDLRRKAILRIKDTYSDASYVLVLDSSLERLQICPSIEECLARIYRSSWMRRCWTLQELSVAKSCFVRFSNGFFDLSSNSSLVLEGNWPSALLKTFAYDSTHYYLARQFQDVSNLRYMIDPHGSDSRKAERFARAWNSLSFRATSREGDRFIILALQLNLDLATVLNATDVESKIRGIFMNQKILPLHMLTVNVSRQDLDGFRWAPATFTSSTFDLRTNDWPGYGSLDTAGLHLTQQGYVLTGPVHFTEWLALVDLEANTCRIVVHIPEEPDSARTALEEEWGENSSCICLIFDGGCQSGVRLSMLDHRPNGERMVRYNCKIGSIECPWPLPADLHDVDPRTHPGIALTGASTVIRFVHGQKTRETQKWCIR
jgi:hypothetical protein